VVTQIEKPRLSRSVAWVAGGMVAAVASLVPAYVAVAFFMGSKPAELAGLFSSAGGIIGTIGWLDQTRERVPFRTAVRALARGAGRVKWTV
jgi:hypothetical protein